MMNQHRYDLLQAAARKHPGAPALLTPEEGFTYAALDRRVAEMAGQLRAHGCVAETRVACYLPRDEVAVMLLLALWRLGATACPLSTRTPPQALAPMLENLRARVFVTADPAAAPDESGAYGIRVIGPADLAEGASARVAPAPWSLDRPATILFTSGSTGAPKAVLHTLGNHYFSAKGSNANIALHPGDRWLLSLPLYHVGGLGILFRCLLAGAAVAIPSAGASLEAALARHRGTHVSMVATQLQRLLRTVSFHGDQALKAVLLGGGPLPSALLDEAHAYSWPLHTSYGCTEMASQVATTPPGAGRAALRTAGRVLAHRELKIAPDGEVLVRGRTRFQGYVDGRGIERPFDEEGWFSTGDVGRLDAEERLRIEGRKDHQFVTGGENIQPEEIEAVLGRLDGVEQAAVVSVPDEVFGRRPVAFVQTRNGDAPDPSGLARRLEAKLPRFKIPDAFLPWPEKERAGLKVDRAFLREEARRRGSGKTEKG